MTPSNCPICGEPAAPGHHPFCSARHRDRDLLAWLGEAYRVPAEPAGEGLDKPENRD